MLKYTIYGNGYDAILVSSIQMGLRTIVHQYYTSSGKVVKATKSMYSFDINKNLLSVETNDTDTLVLPIVDTYTVCNNFLHGHSIKRVVVPRECNVHFGDRAFQDIPNLTHYISLSKNTTYGSNVFPSTVTMRRF